MSINNILEIYWKNQGLEIIRNHMLIEVNLLRKKYWIDSLILNEPLNKACQQHSEYMEKNMITGHAWKNNSTQTIRAKNNNYKWNLIYENVGFIWFLTKKSIHNILQQEIDSEKHFQTLINRRMKYFWFWCDWLHFTTNLWR
jgi:uncharacterized protein YkwD